MEFFSDISKTIDKSSMFMIFLLSPNISIDMYNFRGN